MKLAFVFPGQGSQKVGMLAGFDGNDVAADVMRRADAALGQDLTGLIANGPEANLNLTVNTQPAMLASSYAMYEAWLAAGGMRPAVMAGHSLGEYTALTAAGVFTLEEAVGLVRFRAQAMQSAVPVGVGAMAAILGMTGEAIEEVIRDMENVSVANYNCPGQIVITGETKAVEKAAEALKEAGAKRAVMLNVSGPFHSPMMKPAGEELAKVLEKTELSELQIPYVTNVTAEYVSDISETKALLAEQVASTVRWQESMERMIAEGVDTFVEIGPGKTLAGFMRKINRNVKMYNIGTWEDVEKVTAELLA